VRYTGTISSLLEGKVMAEVPGRVVAVPVAEGQWVEKGQVMVKLDGDLLRLQMQAAEVQVEGLEKDQQRYSILTGADAVQGVQLEKTELALRGARIQLSTLKEQVQRTTITAPFSGFVTQLGVEVGTVLNPSMPVAMLTNDRALELVVSVPGAELTAFRKGQTVMVLPESGEAQVPGTVESVGSRGDMAHNFTGADHPESRCRPWRETRHGRHRALHTHGCEGVAHHPGQCADRFHARTRSVCGAERHRQAAHDRNGRTQAVAWWRWPKDLKPGDIVVTSGFISLADGTREVPLNREHANESKQTMTITEIAIKRPSLIIVIFGVLLLGGVVAYKPWCGTDAGLQPAGDHRAHHVPRCRTR
jgi:biotin carboxyl carrier protein